MFTPVPVHVSWGENDSYYTSSIPSYESSKPVRITFDNHFIISNSYYECSGRARFSGLILNFLEGHNSKNT